MFHLTSLKPLSRYPDVARMYAFLLNVHPVGEAVYFCQFSIPLYLFEGFSNRRVVRTCSITPHLPTRTKVLLSNLAQVIRGI